MTRYKLRGYVREALTPEEDAIEAAHEEQSAIRREAEKVAEATRKANEEYGADIIIFPELSISSYPPEDLLLRPAFNESVNTALEKIKTATKDIHVLLGYPLRMGGKLYNACSLIYENEVKKT